MPDPPHVGLLTRYVLESPVPLAVVLAAIGAIVAWRAGGRRPRLIAAAALAVAAAAVIAAGSLVTTSGERARGVVDGLVADAVAGNVAAARAFFTDDAALSLGSPTNPGYPAEWIHRRIDKLGDQYRIASNRVTMLDAYSESADRATVHLACWTELVAGFGQVPTQWVVRVERRPGDSWKIVHVTWISIAGRSPSPDDGL